MAHAALIVRIGWCLAGLLGLGGVSWAREPSDPGMPMTNAQIYRSVEFATLPGWGEDDHAAALAAFKLSCSALQARNAKSGSPLPGVDTICAAAANTDDISARAFFERNFVPNRVQIPVGQALLTAYYEPIVEGRRTREPGYLVPLHRRPGDLVNLVHEADRASASTEFTHLRKTADGTAPFPTRQEIDQDALAGRNLEIFFVADEVERFFLQIQGSGIVRLADGTQVRVTYDGKNGYPYTSVGRALIDSGAISADKMSLQTLATWLRADHDRGQRAMWQNKSYVFFRALPDAQGPIGVLDAPLTPRRSLAIDPAHHALGLPVFIDAPEIRHITGKPFRHLLVGQDVGSAIKGPARGDIYAGSGPAAGEIAGITKHPGDFYVLIPKSEPPNLQNVRP